MRKKRVLMLTEASYLNTGYSTYGYELLKRLYKSHKYEIAEHSIYGSADHPDRSKLPWKTYPNKPCVSDPKEAWDLYNSTKYNQFGAWRFNRIVEDFRPDAVLSIRDTWMDSFIDQSIFRKCFKWIWMVTCDARPQNPDWISLYSTCDKVLTYSDWATGVLRSHNTNMNLGPSASPAVPPEFSPVEDKRAHKSKMGIDPDTKIVGTVMRNQRRKRFPKLFQGFREYLNRTGDNTILYCHTSYPDNGWDIPKYLLKYDLSTKVLFTYSCGRCKGSFPLYFNGARTICPSCKDFTATPSGVENGATAEQLSNIYNLFDLYIQPASNEGFGLPVVEAAACGIPVAVTNYSAMEDFVHKLDAIPIEPEALDEEFESDRLMAVVDHKAIADILTDFFAKPAAMRLIKGKETYEKFLEHYNWDKTAKVWMDAIDEVGYGDWDSPPNIFTPSNNCPEGLNNAQFIEWAVMNILGRPGLLNSLFSSSLIRDLNLGVMKPMPGSWFSSDLDPTVQQTPINRDMIIKNLTDRRNADNFWESVRSGLRKLEVEEWMK